MTPPGDWPIPCAPFPSCGDVKIESEFVQLPLDRILERLMGGSANIMLSVNDLEVPDLYTGVRPEALCNALLELIRQLCALLPPEQAPFGVLAERYGRRYLDAIGRSTAPHLFKMGYLFGRKQPEWKGLEVYMLAAGRDIQGTRGGDPAKNTG